MLARYVLDGLGLDIRKDFEAILLDSAGEGPPMVLEGRAAAMWGATRVRSFSPARRCPTMSHTGWRALHRGHNALVARIEQARESTLENTLAAAPSRGLIHPGVLRYMKETGIG